MERKLKNEVKSKKIIKIKTGAIMNTFNGLTLISSVALRRVKRITIGNKI